MGPRKKPGRIAKLCAVHGHPPLFAISATFIYKMLGAPTKNRRKLRQFLCFCQEFSKCDSILTIRRAAAVGWQWTNAVRRFVATSGSLPFVFTLTQCVASTIYEEKGT